MNPIRVTERSIGVNFSTRGEAEVLVWAPRANQVLMYLPDEEEKLNLIKREFGYWSCITTKAKLGDHYYFELDGEKYPDPASLFQPQGVDGPSKIVTLHTYSWADDSWTNIPLDEYIFYELHTGTFTEQGTFSGIEERLGYLKDLGINAIEIMPVAQFPGKRNWGYDGVFPFAVQNSYGGPIAFQSLIDRCHQLGIAVVLDVVYNHLGPEGNNLSCFGAYFTDKYKTPWGSAINFDDAECDAVRRYFIENALMWFRDFHVDALRLDAVHAIKDLSPVHILKELKQHVDKLIEESGRTHYLIAECDLNDVKYIQPVKQGGYGMDAQWVDEFHHALRVTAGNERRGYYEDFNGVLDLAKSFNDGYVFDGRYSEHRKKTFGTSTKELTGEKFIVFSQNHDQIGNRMMGERTSALVSFQMQKLMAACVLLSPYLPMLFMGEEYAEPNPFLYFVDHHNKELIQAVREGRRKEFSAFHQGESVPDPKGEQTFRQSMLTWDIQHKGKHAVMLDYYRHLIKWRKIVSWKRGNDGVEIKAYEEINVMVIRMNKNGHQFLYVMNFSSEQQRLEIESPKMNWVLLLNSDDSKWLGSSFGRPTQLPNSLIVPAESFLLFEAPHV